MTTNSRQLDSKVNCGMCGKPLVYGLKPGSCSVQFAGKSFRHRFIARRGIISVMTVIAGQPWKPLKVF
jgi:hypothetical protein